MTYATLMVHLELGQSNAGLLKITASLAERFHARVVGIAARQPIQIIYNEGYVAGEIVEDDLKETKKEMEETEAEFRSALQTRVRDLEWRSKVMFGPLSDYLAREARSADLVITGVDRSGSLISPSRNANTSDFVMRVGRPVLIVPDSVERLKVERVVVGWKDTRETRRAVLDALPLLKQAADVTVVEIASEEKLTAARRHVEDVTGWLKGHGVPARFLALPSGGDDVVQLKTVVQEQSADLIVAGAYGHSRLREWVLGGVTDDLLLRADRCSLVSH
jgi:nucleotide-binding universal stress UspA family protein